MQLMRAALVFLAIVLAPALAHAQTSLSMRGGYYKERSTRVIQPMLDASVDATADDHVEFHALVDSITSASASTGSPTGQSFTERRYEGGAGYTRKLGRLSLGGAFKYSDESDYTSYYGAAHGAIELAQKNTTLGLTVGRGFDTITNGIASQFGGAYREEKLQVGLTSLTLTQLVTPTLVAEGSLELADLHGYQANLYRRVTGGTIPAEERVPDLRLRTSLALGVRGFSPVSRTTGVLSYRFYVDDWGIKAHTAEARVIQEITPGLDVRVRYRFYTQNAADFYKPVYTQADIDDTTVHITADAKLSAFHTQIFGLQWTAALSLFGVTGRWGDVRVDAEAERVLQSNAFGDAWTAQLGLVVPFAN
jgi:hypothetical protein